jgi:hypothetical protein
MKSAFSRHDLITPHDWPGKDKTIFVSFLQHELDQILIQMLAES